MQLLPTVCLFFLNLNPCSTSGQFLPTLQTSGALAPKQLLHINTHCTSNSIDILSHNYGTEPYYITVGTVTMVLSCKRDCKEGADSTAHPLTNFASFCKFLNSSHVVSSPTNNLLFVTTAVQTAAVVQTLFRQNFSEYRLDFWHFVF